MRFLSLLVLLSACASPPSTPDAGSGETPAATPIDEAEFDAMSWMSAVEATDDEAELIALSTRLLDAVDWRTACGEDDPTAPRRGVAQIHHLDADRALAEITCQMFAYQSTFALVDARGGRPPRLVRALSVSEDGEVGQDTLASFFGVFVTAADDPPRFDVLSKSAGHGGCGVATRYDLQPDGGAAVVRIRAHPDCDDPLSPDDWPVTYTR